jgi:2-polyprenyl-6-methoxyphenol hydroxylase-like FAD-dependent oxidoreductase
VESTDVVIAGAGPVGLMLAAELRLGGVDPVVLERLPVSPLHVLAMPQRQLERLLAEWLAELGGSVRRGHEVLGISLAGDGPGVTLDVRGPGGEYRLRGRYLVGCDGAHSLVRKQAGIGFPGVTSSDVSRIGRVVLPTVTIVPGGGQADLPGVGRVRLMGQNQTPRGIFSLAPLASVDKNAAPGVFIVHTAETGAGSPARAADGGADAEPPMTLGELRASVQRVLGADLEMTDPQWLTRTVGTSRQAELFRDGPVLLAGDAAHLFGAAGSLNAGLLDALNLGWKLAAQVRGWAPDGLLDSYHVERSAAARRTILQSRAHKALADRSEYGQALRDLFAELMTYPESVRHVGAMIEGSDVRYQTRPAAPAGTHPAVHPLTGWLAPDLPLETSEGRTRVAELVRPARGVLLDLTGPGEVAGAASAWGDRISVVTARCLAAGTQPAVAAILIRPDGYVAWASGPEAPDPAAGLRDALAAWFGADQARAANPDS